MSQLVRTGKSGLDALKRDASRPKVTHQEDVVLCLDVSASMSTNLKILKSAARAFLDDCHAGVTRSGVIAFDQKAEVLIPVTPSLDAAKSVLDRLHTKGSTDFCAGINASAALLCDSSAGLKRILFMSDGEHIGSGDPVESARISGAVIDTVAFGSFDTSILEAMSRVTGGVFRRALDHESLVRVFRSLEAHERKLLGGIK
jgi:Mg-chelatase subunit ChlD